jgi:hypothetical protein
VGAETLSALYRQLEQLGQAQKINEARDLFVQVRKAHDGAVTRIGEILEGTPT